MTPLKCINCNQWVAEEDAFRDKKHAGYMHRQFSAELQDENTQATSTPSCICNECVFYRVQSCMGCQKAHPLCMYTLDQWFLSETQQRRCLECTALEDTVALMAVVKGAPASRYIMQCVQCLDFKLLCSFLLLDKELGKRRRAVREGSQSDGGVCLHCQLSWDIGCYKKALYDKHRLEVSFDPLPGQQHSTLSAVNTTDNHVPQTMSYAKAVVGGQTTNLGCKPSGELKSNAASEGRGPEFFIASLQDFLCESVNAVLCDDIPRLLKKIQLELQLRNLPLSIATHILQRKLRETSHSFSVQATETTNFFDPETRWAYMAIYTPVHASIVCNTLMHSKVTPLVNLLQTCGSSPEQLQVCCFGAGPGSEVLGLHKWFPSNTLYHLFDNCTLWQHSAALLVQRQLDLDFTYSYIDMMYKLEQTTAQHVKASKLFTFIKFLSAVQSRSTARDYLRSVFNLAPHGSLFLFVDNCSHEIRHFIEGFVFPGGKFEQKTNFKESRDYRLFSTYSEFRFDIDDVTASSPNVCDWLSLLMEWVERPPLVELRVFIFVVEKL